MQRLFQREEAQVLPIMALLLVAFIGLLGLAIDVGRLYVAKTELSRAADSAALAGVVELPDVLAAQSVATVYLQENVPDASASFPPTSEDFQIRVKATRDVDMVFMSIFGFDSVQIGTTAAAGFGRIPIDAVMAVDATGSMGDAPCNGARNNSGCPIKEAKDAAVAFTGILLSNAQVSGDTQVGMGAYRGCYDPPVSSSTCVPDAWTIDLSANQSAVQSAIGAIDATGGSGTNVCLGLWKANQIVFGPNAHSENNTRRFVVLLSDGDNNYNSISYANGQPPVECRPNNPGSGSGSGGNCGSPVSQEQTLDGLTLAMADQLKAADVEVYVVGFGVCGSANSSACNRGMVGGSAADTAADRNLLKCLASSTNGTNDHYIEVGSATNLPDVFSDIARRIAFRLVE